MENNGPLISILMPGDNDLSVFLEIVCALEKCIIWHKFIYFIQFYYT